MKTQQGMTLIEVVVSIFIIASILIGMIALFSLGAIQSTLTRHKISAINIAQARLEELKEAGYKSINPGIFPTQEGVTIDKGRTDSSSDDLNGIMRTGVSTITEGYKIIVTVSWVDYYGQISEVLETVIANLY